jgi:putative SOS response-associated peptidase YedK
VCGRYVRKSTRREIARWFEAEDTAEWGASYNVAPQTFQPVVRLNRDGRREIALLRWGLIPYWAKNPKIGLSTINAKAETVPTAPAFRDAFARRRCLVPADAFYEWQKLDPKHKQPFAIALASREPYGFAGLWERWRDPDTNEWLETFSIITTEPNELVEPLHNRMPVIIERKDYARWLGGPAFPEPPLDLLRPYPAGQMTAWKVDAAVGNVRNDSAELLIADMQHKNAFLPGFEC